MRSFLFVPADGGPKLDKTLASGADAVILDLEDSIVPERKPAAREAALAFLKKARGAKQRPRLLVRINGLDTGMTDADLDAIVAGRPDAVVFPKAEGGPSVVHLDAKLTAREAIAGVPEGHIKILAQAVESAAGLFAAGNFRNASPRLIGLTWGPEDLSAELGAATNRDARGELIEPYLSHAQCAFTRQPRRKCRPSKPSTSTSAIRMACAAIPKPRVATVSRDALPFTRPRCR
jgi:citrate lyase subunit beta/citryl-CoA lyase